MQSMLHNFCHLRECAITVYVTKVSFLYFTSKLTREINKKDQKEMGKHRHVLNVNVFVPYNFLYIAHRRGITFDTYNRLTVGGF